MMKKITKYLYIMAAAVLLAACSNDLQSTLSPEEFEGPLEVQLAMPDFTDATRAVAESSIENIYAVYLGATSNYISTEALTLTGSSVKMNVPRGTAQVHFIANADAAPAAVPTSVVKTSAPAAGDRLGMWGYSSLANLLSSASSTVSLQRMVAKVNVTKAASVTSFDLTGFYLCNTDDKGCFAPAGYNYSASSPNTVAGAGSTDVMAAASTSDYLYAYETAAGTPYVIIKGEYEGVEYYYHCDFVDADGNNIPLLRNHWYTINITRVEAKGFDTIDEAKVAAGANRMTYEVQDHQPNIINLVACRDYALGVCENVHVDATATTATVYFVVHRYNDNCPDISNVHIDTEGTDWILTSSGYTYTTMAGSADNTGGYSCQATLTLTTNPHTEAREGYVTVTYGDLRRDIVVVQEGRDIAADASRTIYMHGLPGYDNNGSTNVTTYFTYLNGVKGIQPSQNGGAVLTKGIHFPCGKTMSGNNEVYYYIPYRDGDALEYSGSHLSISHGYYSLSGASSGNYWRVALSSYGRDTSIWTDKFTIKNGSANFAVPVYHQGYFHRWTQQTGHQLANNMNTYDTYYYGVQEINGIKVLDRNIGAVNNGYYASSMSTMTADDGPDYIGTYFRILNHRDGSNKPTLINSTSHTEGTLDPIWTDMTIPSEAQFRTLNVVAETRSLSSGEKYICIEAKDPSSGKIIYFPRTGYIEEDDLKNADQTCVWTSSFLSGAQGFSSDSPDYGFWVIYLNARIAKITYANMRAVGGYNGTEDGMYKGMPLRLILK